MKWKLASFALILAVLGAFVMAPITARAQDTLTIDPIPVTASKNNGTKNFEGEWTITRFVEQDGALFAEGVLTGDVTNKHDKVTNTVEETVLLPVAVSPVSSVGAGAVRAQATGDCDVLELVLGPITLDLLGLNLFIGGAGDVPILIDLDATPSEGLLGQILCGLAGGLPLGGLIGGLQDLLDFLNALNALFGLFG
jgi:hypothetical protein